jgi:16S rRNA (guanine1207-N2)-methyltransferase
MINITINNIPLKFATHQDLFSPAHVDRGTLAMLSTVEFTEGDKVLDLGCGYGVVGIAAAKIINPRRVVMSDISETAVRVSRENAVLNGVGDAGANDSSGVKIILSDGFTNISDKDFTLILSNPPYQVDFSVPKHFIEKGFNRLAPGGKMYMVTKRKLWYRNKFIAIFGGVKIIETDGYYVFCAEKRASQYANTKHRPKQFLSL